MPPKQAMRFGVAKNVVQADEPVNEPIPVEETKPESRQALPSVADTYDLHWTKLSEFAAAWAETPKTIPTLDEKGNQITYAKGGIARLTPDGQPMLNKRGGKTNPSIEFPVVECPYGIEVNKKSKYGQRSMKIEFSRENPEHVKFTDDWIEYVDGNLIDLVVQQKAALGSIPKFTKENPSQYTSRLYLPLDQGTGQEQMDKPRTMFLPMFMFEAKGVKGSGDYKPEYKTEFYYPGIDQPLPYSEVEGFGLKGIPIVRILDMKRSAQQVTVTLQLQSFIVLDKFTKKEFAAQGSAVARRVYENDTSAGSAAREAYLAGLKAGIAQANRESGSDGANRLTAAYGGAQYAGGAADILSSAVQR